MRAPPARHLAAASPPVNGLSRSQLLAYGALIAALLVLGARWIRSGDGAASGYARAPASPGPAAGFSLAQRGGEDVVVDVAGAVRSPGVYRLPAGSRVTDAVERAGGATEKAELDAINLAALLADGQQVVVPTKAAAGPALGGAAGAAGSGPISLGTATVEDLDTIEGIGPVTAQKIIEYRDQHGGVASIDQLDEIDGIGPATLEALKARLQP